MCLALPQPGGGGAEDTARSLLTQTWSLPGGTSVKQIITELDRDFWSAQCHTDDRAGVCGVQLSSGIGCVRAVPALLFVVWPSLLGCRSGMRVMVARSSQRAGEGAVRDRPGVSTAQTRAVAALTRCL